VPMIYPTAIQDHLPDVLVAISTAFPNLRYIQSIASAGSMGHKARAHRNCTEYQLYHAR